MSLRDCPEAQSLPAATMRHTVPKYDMAGPVGSRPVHAEHLPRRWVYTAVPPRYHSQGAAVQYNRALAPAADSGWSRTDLLQRLIKAPDAPDDTLARTVGCCDSGNRFARHTHSALGPDADSDRRSDRNVPQPEPRP